MVILTLLAYGCYKEKQKEETKTKNTAVKDEGESEQHQLENIERELDQLKEDPDDFNYDYGDPENLDRLDKQFDYKIKDPQEQPKEEERSLSPRSKYQRRAERRMSPQRYPYKVQPYLPRPTPPFHHQPPIDQSFPPKEHRYYHQDHLPRYQPYHHRSYPPEPPRHGYYYYNNNNNSMY